MGFFNSIFGPRNNRSAQVAKERLATVLVDDRYKLTPEMKEQMKLDIAEVLARYLPSIDPDQIEVTLLRGESNDHLKADIPLRRGGSED
ncbi:cell division topological specificity factor MinE [Oscillochloris trichoides DG-6]|uniref:Cell division topological specificity factor n=1 Tax=Oscillochloris trichoides DG-6 TaxID=765420 RepID=E1IAA8_9CHLR|nr:cell division topological specificity factor MinE [Oscillochloris trichoides]EFO81862.1 cell division topological specificity factor MinE [Oscillochloris trichoides DG-6]